MSVIVYAAALGVFLPVCGCVRNDGLCPSLCVSPCRACVQVTDLVRHFLRACTPQRKNDALSPSCAHLTDTAMHTVTDSDRHFLRTHTQ